MATIGDFSSVFEIGFGVNAVLHYLEINPAHRSRLYSLTYAIKDLRDKCKEKGIAPPTMSEDISTEWAFQWVLRGQRQLWQYMTIAVSLLALFMLILGAYLPEMTFPWWMSGPIVILMFFVPYKAYAICNKIEEVMEDNLFATAELIDVDVKDFMASRSIVVRKKT